MPANGSFSLSPSPPSADIDASSTTPATAFRAPAWSAGTSPTQTGAPGPEMLALAEALCAGVASAVGRSLSALSEERLSAVAPSRLIVPLLRLGFGVGVGVGGGLE